VERHHVVAAAQRAERLLVALGLEIGDEGDDAAAAHHALREAQRPREVGAPPEGLPRQQVAHDAQGVVAAAPRGHVALDPVGEEHRPHPVVVGHRGEGEHGRELRRVVPLQQVLRAELLRAGHVHHEQEGQVPLLDELLHVGRAHPRGDVPVDRAHLVARGVLPDLGELHAAALEDGVVGPADPGLEDHLRPDLDAPDLPEGLPI
jgi:hypothetical protein